MSTLTQHPGKPAAFRVPMMTTNQWLPQLFRCSSAQTRRGEDVNGWGVGIEHQGRHHTFVLRAESKEDAAVEARDIYDTLLAEGWDAALRNYSCLDQAGNELSPNTIDYWKERLLVRRYHFPATAETDNDWAVKIDYAGTAYWFPLGSSDAQAAAGKARDIYKTVVTQGWAAACNHFSRELIVSFEWCASPILWTYTTIHTLVESAATEPASEAPKAGACRVIILEADAGIRRALQWCVSQQPGFQAVPCASPELLTQALAIHKPSLVLLNRSLAERVGVTFVNGPVAVRPGALALGYSVSVDGDQMFVSTPGGAEGYMLKRVKPSGLFDPVLAVVRPAGSAGEDFSGAVRSYFKELLRLRFDGATSALARLTPRENDVLALLAKGCVDKEIAQALGISVWTVHGHIKKIFERLQVRTRTEAVVRYLEK